jgi:hypothetical protein
VIAFANPFFNLLAHVREQGGQGDESQQGRTIIVA